MSHNIFMQDNDFIKKIKDLLLINKIDLTDFQLRQLLTYYSLSQEWGQKMNITTNLSFENYATENILDPVIALSNYSKILGKIEGLVDLGAGGGYIGITAKILFPELTCCYLIESVRKKVSFLQQVIRTLNLTQTEALHLRAEEFSIKEGYDTVVSRATWHWDDFKKIGQPFQDAQKHLVSFEGPKAHASQKTPPEQVIEYEIRPFAKNRYLYCL